MTYTILVPAYVDHTAFLSPNLLVIVVCILWLFFFKQGHELAQRLGHSIVEPQPSLFTFKVKDAALAELAGVCGILTSWVAFSSSLIGVW
jgi:hypothetical protein